MSTWQERRIAKIMQRLRARTKKDGTPMPGYEQNVATLRAEIEQLSIPKGNIDA